MSEIKRWELFEIGPAYHKRTEMLTDDDGNWISYEDYAALQQKLEAVLAENVALKERERRILKNIHEDLGDTDFHLATLQTPATDAYLNAVRADGVDILADKFSAIGTLATSHIANEMRAFAAQLRAGNAGKDGSHE
ncbi:hypothetical protein PQD17_gp36 [Pantoea phage PdC23]|uniref:Uncharacterized protein n=1 Tax=Pantoea phage PdC23 TaxID=2894356 RepID=A0AAE8YLP2_9CAUD|nr:hypothetical protein PQD17_gp36 [Pantoea phage PdC23]UGC97749.1 hypothetical protein pdc_036 [Pantoea phage PdC23]